MVESEAFAEESERKEAFVSIPRVNHNFGRVQLKPKARKRHRRPPRNSAAFLEDFSETQKLNFFAKTKEKSWRHFGIKFSKKKKGKTIWQQTVLIAFGHLVLQRRMLDEQLKVQ